MNVIISELPIVCLIHFYLMRSHMILCVLSSYSWRCFPLVSLPVLQPVKELGGEEVEVGKGGGGGGGSAQEKKGSKRRL